MGEENQKFRPGEREIEVKVPVMVLSEEIPEGRYGWEIELKAVRVNVKTGKEKETGEAEIKGELTVDITPPEIKSINGEEIKGYYIHSVTEVPEEIEIVIEDELSGVEKVEVEIDGEQAGVAEAGEGRYLVRLPEWGGEGVHEIKIKAEDRAGNVSEKITYLGIYTGLTRFSIEITGAYPIVGPDAPPELAENIPLSEEKIYISPDGDGYGDVGYILVLMHIEEVLGGEDYEANPEKYEISIRERIKNRGGEEIYTLEGGEPLSGGFVWGDGINRLGISFYWEGRDKNGNRVPDGVYTWESEIVISKIIDGRYPWVKVEAGKVERSGEVVVDTVAPVVEGIGGAIPGEGIEIYDRLWGEVSVDAYDDTGLLGAVVEYEDGRREGNDFTGGIYTLKLTDLECGLNEVKVEVWDYALNAYRITQPVEVIDTVPPELVAINFEEPMTYYVEEIILNPSWFFFIVVVHVG